MKNTFLNRVSAERRVLSVVNENFSREGELAGLSQAAISRWRTVVVGAEWSSTIIPLLNALAEQCQSLSDRSNETFMPIEEAQAKEIDKRLMILKSELQKCR